MNSRQPRAGQGAVELPKKPLVIALILALVLTAGVLVGTKAIYGDGRAPIALPPLPNQTDDPSCTAFVKATPDKLLGLKRATITEPVPTGATAWSGYDGEHIIARCGVAIPEQFTQLSSLQSVDGHTWLQVTDATRGSSLKTWFAVDHTPIVAITADDESLGKATNPLDGLSAAIDALTGPAPEPAPAPLSALVTQPVSPRTCDAWISSLPTTLKASDLTYTRSDQAAVNGVDGYDDRTALWTTDQPGYEPIVARCGVPLPDSYRPGETVEQVNDVAWFNDRTLAQGSTLGTWYALGRTETLAVSVSQEAASSVIPELTALIVKTVPASSTAK